MRGKMEGQDPNRDMFNRPKIDGSKIGGNNAKG
jgi:hypothetical protein